VRGVPDAGGILPVIEGSNAVTRTQLNFWNEERGVIKVGGANQPPDTMPRHIVIEALDIKSARPPFRFTGRNGDTAYADNAAAIYVEKGEAITVRGCILRDCGNGFFCASGSSNVLVEGCFITDNGIEGSIYQHNTYTEARGITFQYNRFGPLRAGCPGNNLKDRSSGCSIRYNWIESGNRQLDLVDSDHSALYGDPAYRATFVYGNVLLEPDGAGNNQICHYGGDSGVLERYRKGTLHFFHNTVYSTRAGTTTLLRLSSGEETAECRNNVVQVTAGGTYLAMLDDTGRANLYSNWLRTGWRLSHSNPTAAVVAVSGILTGADPGFTNAPAQDFGLLTNSPCVNQGQALAGLVPPAHLPGREYARHQAGVARRHDGRPDIGAFECGVDADGDGMPDWWEWQHSASTTGMTRATDADADAFADWKEYAAGTDPTNPLSQLRFSDIQSLGSNGILLRWSSVEGKRYRLLGTTNLLATPSFPAALRTNVPAAPPWNTHTDSPAVNPRASFYRIQLED
jgi:hypothetical protein